ncbi:lectin [Papiliotrema laurentii]|uniref:Lectin n=1 Tax=Papiliotrema laurentii TaxID=5418 RepID=A0AAD9CU34_PAPLA|nr:lectin [Papiliotrema laurentii]
MKGRIAAFAISALCLASGGWAETKVAADLEEMIEKAVPLRTHSLAAPYVDTDLQNRWWDFGGDAIINTNKHVRLTQDRPSESGWLWSRMPLSMSNWQVEVEFKVDGRAHNLFADGFAFWITKDRATSGPVFGSVDYFTGLGIFFDTYANARHAYQWPRVSAMLGDGKTAYDHDHDNEAHEIAACSDNFRRRDIPTKARLTYLKGKTLQLDLQTKEEGVWKKCFAIDAMLPDSPYVGFSAATGDVHDNHDIVSVQTFSVILKPEYRDDSSQAPMRAGVQASNTASTKAEKKPKRRGSSGGAAGWFLFILKLIGVGAFIAFAVAAVRTYNAQKKSRRAW